MEDYNDLINRIKGENKSTITDSIVSPTSIKEVDAKQSTEAPRNVASTKSDASNDNSLDLFKEEDDKDLVNASVNRVNPGDKKYCVFALISFIMAASLFIPSIITSLYIESHNSIAYLSFAPVFLGFLVICIVGTVFASLGKKATRKPYCIFARIAQPINIAGIPAMVILAFIFIYLAVLFAY